MNTATKCTFAEGRKYTPAEVKQAAPVLYRRLQGIYLMRPGKHEADTRIAAAELLFGPVGQCDGRLLNAAVSAP
jgi:hypothetical protein